MDDIKAQLYQKALRWSGQQSTANFHTIFNCEDKAYQYWQSELLAFSYRKANQPGPLTQLLSCDIEPKYKFTENMFKAKSFSKHPLTKDDYCAYNKPAAIVQWLEQQKPQQKNIMIIDPDCVFLGPITREIKRGQAIGQLYSYMWANGPCGHLVKRHCRKNQDLVAPVGIPIIIHRDDLKLVAPRWLEVTQQIRDDFISRQVGWIVEMWGYTIAAAEMGIRHDLQRICVFTVENDTNASLIHYCCPSENEKEGFFWAKGSYRPWLPPEMPPPGTVKAAVALAELLKEAAEYYGNVYVGSNKMPTWAQ
jgi:hypothetical protein